MYVISHTHTYKTQGLLSEEGLHRVAHAACTDMRRILARYRRQFPWRDWTGVVEQLNRDVGLANKQLRSELQVELLPVPSDELRRWKSAKQSVVVERH